MKKSVFTFFILSIFSIFLAVAQKNLLKHEFLDGEFFLVEEEYEEALQAYMKVYNSGHQENANINYRIGICYINIPGEKDKSIFHLNKAVQNVTSSYKEGVFKNHRASSDAWLYLGNAYRINHQFDEAINAYETFLNLNGEKTKTFNKEYAKQQILASERARISVLSPSKIELVNLGQKFNTVEKNFNPVFSGNGNAMAYMTSQRFYDAVYYVRKLNNIWTNPVNITSQIESDGDQYLCSLSWDGTKMFLAKVSSFNSDIMESEFVSGRWTKSIPLGKNINSKYFESHASLSPDGNTLYFTSNRKESLGGMDIFFSVKNPDGKWGIPENLGPVVNTELNEESPFICEDGKTLFFSSQGHESIGGYDIFYTVKQDDGSWSKPVALPYPVNTTDDDLFFFPSENGRSGYQTQFLADGYGSGDIYHINLFPEMDLAELSEEPSVKEKEIAEISETESTTETEIVEEAPALTEEVEEATTKYSIQTIYFNFDKFSLTKEATESLDILFAAMKDNPELILEVRGHTDSMGPNSYNQILSERRAKAAIDYLVSKGIEKDRLKEKGFSFSEPIAINKYADGSDSKEGRSYNRRVDFRLLTQNIDNVIIEAPQIPDALKIKN